jgi:hypothetical protein
MHVTEIHAELVGSVPVPEVSGMALGLDREGVLTLAAVGDRSTVIAWASVAHGYADLEWQSIELAGLPGTRIPAVDPQLEAVAVDGQRRLVVVQEHPCRAEVIDAPTRRLIAHVQLAVAQGAPESIARSWADPHSSHAEGVVLLKDGHLLVVKEKDPVAVLEFGPAGSAPRGFGPGRWLDAGEGWAVPAGEPPVAVTLELLAAWWPTEDLLSVCPDLSDATVGLRGNLVLLSDLGRSIAIVPGTVPAQDPMGGVLVATSAYRMGGIAKKPEAVVVLPDGDVLVACDRRKPRKNLFVIRREAWDLPE